MGETTLYGGPWDGSGEVLKYSYETDGVMRRREGWPLIIEVRAYTGERPPDSAAPQGQGTTQGRRIARYRFTQRVTSDGYQVYEHVPD